MNAQCLLDFCDAEEALLCMSESGYREDGLSERILRYAMLSSLNADGQELLEAIEEVYASFDYPSDMEPFIYYMPSTDSDSSIASLVAKYRLFSEEERENLGLKN